MVFKWGKFTGAAGLELNWKVECDALTAEDWACIARVGAERLPPFSKIIGVPRGGLALAEAFKPFIQHDAPRTLVVDDVWTTGGSMMKAAEGLEADWIGYVAFARGLLPSNVKAFALVDGAIERAERLENILTPIQPFAKAAAKQPVIMKALQDSGALKDVLLSWYTATYITGAQISAAQWELLRKAVEELEKP
jgi:hypothetical protein